MAGGFATSAFKSAKATAQVIAGQGLTSNDNNINVNVDNNTLKINNSNEVYAASSFSPDTSYTWTAAQTFNDEITTLGGIGGVYTLPQYTDEATISIIDWDIYQSEGNYPATNWANCSISFIKGANSNGDSIFQFSFNTIAGEGTANLYYEFLSAPIYSAGLITNSKIQNNMSTTSLSGTTSGSAIYVMPEQGSAYKKFIVYLDAYENTSTTAQTISFATSFSYTPEVSANGTGTTVSVSTSELTLPASMSAAASGFIIVEGF